MAKIKVERTATGDLCKLGDTTVGFDHRNGVTEFTFGFARVKLSDIRNFVKEANDALAAVGEQTL